MRKLLDRIAKRLGYIPLSLIPRVEVDMHIDRPTYVLIDFGGKGMWRQRVAGFVFPALDECGRGISLWEAAARSRSARNT